MLRIFLSSDQISGDRARITGSDHQHLACVLRAHPGERLLLLDNSGNAFQAILVSLHKTESLAQIETPVALPPEPVLFITAAQALGKGDKFEQVVQHGTEAGASAFIPIRAERGVVEIPASRLPDRLARWRQIA